MKYSIFIFITLVIGINTYSVTRSKVSVANFFSHAGVKTKSRLLENQEAEKIRKSFCSSLINLDRFDVIARDQIDIATVDEESNRTDSIYLQTVNNAEYAQKQGADYVISANILPLEEEKKYIIIKVLKIQNMELVYSMSFIYTTLVDAKEKIQEQITNLKIKEKPIDIPSIVVPPHSFEIFDMAIDKQKVHWVRQILNAKLSRRSDLRILIRNKEEISALTNEVNVQSDRGVDSTSTMQGELGQITITGTFSADGKGKNFILRGTTRKEDTQPFSITFRYKEFHDLIEKLEEEIKYINVKEEYGKIKINIEDEGTTKLYKEKNFITQIKNKTHILLVKSGYHRIKVIYADGKEQKATVKVETGKTAILNFDYSLEAIKKYEKNLRNASNAITGIYILIGLTPLNMLGVNYFYPKIWTTFPKACKASIVLKDGIFTLTGITSLTIGLLDFLSVINIPVFDKITDLIFIYTGSGTLLISYIWGIIFTVVTAKKAWQKKIWGNKIVKKPRFLFIVTPDNITFTLSLKF